MTDPAAAHRLSADTQVVLLLCGRLGRAASAEAVPLAPAEYDALATWLLEHKQRPAALLAAAQQEQLPALGLGLPVAWPRLRQLLARGAALALAVEHWANRGLWVVSRSDPAYPRRLKTGRRGPPLLYGAGDPALVAAGGLAIVGSREADAVALAFARRVAQACAAQGLPVVSGGARGVDSAAMAAALEAGGAAVGVLAASLARAVLAGPYRQALLAGTLALVSPTDPDAGFETGQAMGRNRDIYALADWALVVRCSVGTGGTWAGATAALKAGTPPLFVWMGEGARAGNRKLRDLGALPFPDEPWPDLARALAHAAAQRRAGQPVQLDLLQ